jgi:hypothetical protein
MKFFFVFISVQFLFIASIFSQNQWAPVGAKWYYSHTTEQSPCDYLYTIEASTDTIILSKTVQKFSIQEIYIKYNGSFPNNPYFDTILGIKYMYYDSGKVYQYNNIKNQFDLLYNFKAKTGDTIIIRDTPKSGYKIDCVKKNLFGEDSLLFFYTHDIETTEIIFEGTKNPIIENIGSTLFLFGNGKTGIFSDGKCLKCYDNGKKVYKYCDAGIECNQINSSWWKAAALLSPTMPEIRVDNDQLYINADDIIQKFQITDITGRIIISHNINSTIHTESISQLVSGLYILKIFKGSEEYTYKIIKK